MITCELFSHVIGYPTDSPRRAYLDSRGKFGFRASKINVWLGLMILRSGFKMNPVSKSAAALSRKSNVCICQVKLIC